MVKTKMTEKKDFSLCPDVRCACGSPSELVRLYEKRIKAFGNMLVKSQHTLERVEEEMEKSSEVEEEMHELARLGSEMQNELSKVQGQLLEERRNTLDIVSKNEELRAENEDVKRKYQAALILSKVQETDVVSFVQKNPKAETLLNRIVQLDKELKECDEMDGESGVKLDSPVVLKNRIASLERQMKKSKEQHFTEIYSLRRALDQCREEQKVMESKYDLRIKDLYHKLERAKKMLHNSLNENLELRTKFLNSEEEWAKEQRKITEKLVHLANIQSDQDVISLKHDTDASGRSHHAEHPEISNKKVNRQLIEKLTRAETLLEEKENLIKEYEIKTLRSDRAVANAKESKEHLRNSFSEILRKLRQRNELLEARFNKLAERRKLDNAGFHQDVKNLRELITAVRKRVKIFVNREHWNLRALDKDADVEEEKNSKREFVLSFPKQTTLVSVGKLGNPNSEIEFNEADIKEQLRKDRLIYELIDQVINQTTSHINKLEAELKFLT